MLFRTNNIWYLSKQKTPGRENIIQEIDIEILKSWWNKMMFKTTDISKYREKLSLLGLKTREGIRYPEFGDLKEKFTPWGGRWVCSPSRMMFRPL